MAILSDIAAGIGGLFKGKKPITEIPEPEKRDDVVDYVRAIFEEGIDFEHDHFAETLHLRPGYGSVKTSTTGLPINSPESFRKACDLLEQNNDHEVWGRRNNTPKTAWKQERIDGLINRNMRTRRAYICGNWHDIIISPNIKHISEVFDQERNQIYWDQIVSKYTHTSQRYGTSTARVIVDFSENEDGLVQPMVCEPGTVVRTPHSTSYREKDQCWYVVHGTMVNDKQVEKQYGNSDFDTSKMESATGLTEKYGYSKPKKNTEYAHTKLYTKLEAFLDDPALEDIPVTEEEDMQLVVENGVMMGGVPVEAAEGQHHTEHIRQKKEALENLAWMEKEAETPEDIDLVQRVHGAYKANIDQHQAILDAMDEDDPAKYGKQPKYPQGRYICTIGGVVAQDEPNPYMIPWRRLFRDLKNEDVIGRIDGAGDPEILWQDAKTIDIDKSRIADLILAVTMGKKYRKFEDKEKGLVGENDDDNDPSTTGYFLNIPPVFVHGDGSSIQYLWKSVEDSKMNSTQAQGVNQITIGGEPEGQTSGYQTNLLQRQNEMIVTGELDRNLRAAIEDIVETMIELYKVVYIEPRQYFIDGKLELINVSDILSFEEVTDPQTGRPVLEQAQDETGATVARPVKRPIEKFQITVKPFSNYPNRWESELGELIQVAGQIVNLTKDPMQAQMFAQAIKDKLASKYPEFGPNGKYGQLSVVIQAGQAVLAQQQQIQAEAEGKQKTLDGVAQEFEKKNLRSEFEKTQPQNGKAAA